MMVSFLQFTEREGMWRCLLEAKIHRATVTEVDRDYEGSCGIDAELLRAAGMRAFEQVDVYNVTNGARLTTYVIEAPAGSGTISMNGAAAHYARAGDLVILCTYGYYANDELDAHDPVLVHAGANNAIGGVTRPNAAIARAG